MTADIINLPQRKTIKWDDLPEAMQDLLHELFEAEMRQNFAEIEHELMLCFMEQEHIAKEWHDYKEHAFMQEMHGPDTSCAFEDFLAQRGIE